MKRSTYGCDECLHNGAHVLQVNFDKAVSSSETRLAILTDSRRTASVNGNDLPSLISKVFDSRATKLATSTRNNNSALILASLGLAQSELVGK